MHNDDEWGNLGNFDANDRLALVKATNKRIHEERKNNPQKRKKWLDGQQKQLKKRWENEEWAQKMTETLMSTTQDPERNKKISQAKTEYWKDQDRLDAMSVKAKQQWQDPDYAERVLATQRHAITTPFGEFISKAEFQRQTGLQYRDKNREMPHLYYNTADGPGKVTQEKYLVTPFGEFKTKQMAFDAHCKKDQLYTKKPVTQKGHAWTCQNWWTYVTKNHSDLFTVKTGPRREWAQKGE